jgi:hypothetical protein
MFTGFKCCPSLLATVSIRFLVRNFRYFPLFTAAGKVVLLLNVHHVQTQFANISIYLGNNWLHSIIF